MPAWYQIRFSDGSPEIDWCESRGFYYEFPDGTNIKLSPTIAWCCDCSDFINAEWIPSLDYVVDDLAALNDPTSHRASMFTAAEPPFDTSPFVERLARLYAEAKEEAAKRIEWRRLRKSPPRCLNCGSTEIRFPGDDQSVDIPGRGKAIVEVHGMCSTLFLNWFYTPEGVRIERDTKPSYWHLPEEED